MASDSEDTTIPARPWREICESSDWWINTETADGDVPIDGYVCDSNVGVFRNQQTLNFMLDAVNSHDALVAAITDAARELSMAQHYWEGSPSYTARVKKAESILLAALATGARHD